MKKSNSDKKKKKRKNYFNGVIVRRSWYSFSRYYPGGGSSQKYRKVMNEVPEPHKQIKIILAVFLLLVVTFIGYFSANVAISIANAPTTAKFEESTTQPQLQTPTDTTTEKSKAKEEKTTKKQETTYAVTVEEPEREINITEVSSEETNESSQESY